MINAYFYDTIIGRIGIADNGKSESQAAISYVFFGNSVKPEAFEERETPILKKAAVQLQEYLEGRRKTFELEYEPKGTPFEKKVWKALEAIPYGEVRSYMELAVSIGNPKACRAVGRANGRNPLSIFIPCHRVIGANGRLTGYAGGLDVKKRLLELEGLKVEDGRCRISNMETGK